MTKKYEKIQNLMKRGCDILGSKYAIIGGAMTWISDAALVSAMSNAGIFGVLASGDMSVDILEKEIEAVQQKTSKNFGVNVILANPKVLDLIDTCRGKKVSHIIMAGGVPDRSIIERIHSRGVQAIAFAPTLPIAKRLFKDGIDALILEGNEAGGHVGSVSTLILLQDVLLNLPHYPIFVAGGVLRGEIFAGMLRLGAAGCQLGSIFACSKESTAHENFKKAFFRASARDAVIAPQLHKNFPVSAVRALKNLGTEEFVEKQREIASKFEYGEISLSDGRLTLERFWAGALRRAVQEGDVERGSVMAGQIAGVIKEERSIPDIIDAILSEAEAYLSKFP